MAAFNINCITELHFNFINWYLNKLLASTTSAYYKSVALDSIYLLFGFPQQQRFLQYN